MPNKYQMFIGGKWVDSIGQDTFNDYNPFTGEVYAQVANGRRADATNAIEAASAAFPQWAATSPGIRRKLFLKAADIFEKRQNDLVSALADETGSTIGICMFQMFFVPGLLREAAAQAYNVSGEIIPADYPGAFFMATRQPAGVVAGFGPFNVPFILSIRAIALPIAYGNTAVLKPSEEAPVTGGVLIAEIFEEAGFPPGVLNVITHSKEYAPEIGDELIGHPAVRRISFTGSTENGRIIAEKAGRHLKRCVLELGGKDPLIILKDADLDFAADAATWGAFLHQGQICMSTERIIIDKSIADEFTEKLVQKAKALKAGDPRNPANSIGPLINKAAINKVHSHVQDAISEGATLLTGGKYEGLVYYPTVLTDVQPGMKVFTDQTFGPVAPIVKVNDSEEALMVANNSKYGLSAGIITNDFLKALDMAQHLNTGMVHIGDQTVNDEPQAPFGGLKGSGYGRMGGKAALDEFTEMRLINIQRTRRTFP
ncbi:MAG TPA: aldehyde dehydrogenase family protein [Chitinispirillaceae bacterium]|nr:aldehyde dehydrogenase family protein [Chitinispirillaceae bacterium]